MEPVDRVSAAWPVACGRALAARGEVTGLVGGVLQVEVRGAMWLSQLMGMRSVLEHELARISGVPLTGIHFYLGRDGALRPAP